MHQLLQNKYVRIAGITIAALLVLLAALFIISFSQQLSSIGQGESIADSMNMEYVQKAGLAERAYDETGIGGDANYLPPTPTPQPGYTADLETYETTAYNINGRVKQFDSFCDNLSALKTDPVIHFKSLNTSLNNCHATFYVAEEKVLSTLTTLQQFSGIEINRSTVSVTRHKQQIESRTNILRQQLASVERSLTAAETEFDEIARFAKDSQSARTYSEAIQEKIKLIGNLTQQKINLTSQLDNLYQQATDLQERLGVVEFQVSVSRLDPIYQNQTELAWLRAWNEFEQQLTNFSIAVTAGLLTMGLFGIQIIIYVLIGLVVLRGLWKFARTLWMKW